MAEEELPKVAKAATILPGDFNKSASVIFGGAHAGLYTGDKSWAVEMKKEGIKIDQIGIREEEAKIKFGVGLTVLGFDEQFEKFLSNNLVVIERVPASLEVVDIVLPTDSAREQFEKESKELDKKLGPIDPLGKLMCKTWKADDCDEWDLPKDKYPTGKPHRASTGQAYEFWIEESILKTCFKGLKIDAQVLTLDCGITILDDIQDTMCSFFTWLPNELWMEKKPKEVKWMDKRLPEDDFLHHLEEVLAMTQDGGQLDVPGPQDEAQATGQQDDKTDENVKGHGDEAVDETFDDAFDDDFEDDD